MLGLFAPIFLTCLRILIDRISPFKAQLGGSHTYSLVTLKTTFGLPHLPTLLVALRMNLTKSLSMALNFPLFIPSHVTTLLSQVSFTFEVLNICVFLPMTLHLYEFFYVLINATTILSSHWHLLSFENFFSWELIVFFTTFTWCKIKSRFHHSWLQYLTW